MDNVRGELSYGSAKESGRLYINYNGEEIATVSKEIWHWTDTYIIDVRNSGDALCALMLVLAIDAEKCSRND